MKWNKRALLLLLLIAYFEKLHVLVNLMVFLHAYNVRVCIILRLDERMKSVISSDRLKVKQSARECLQILS